MDEPDGAWALLRSPDWVVVQPRTRPDLGFGDASFPTAEVGYVTDLTWRVFKTEDGGHHWRLLPAIQSSDVAFATPLVGYAIAPDTLRRTEDGGETWWPILQPAPEPIWKSQGALLLPHPGVEDVAPYIDSVLAWYDQTCGEGQPPVPCTVANIVHTITPISETVAYARHPDMILLTEDGGYHWRPIGQSWNELLWSAVRLNAILWYAAAGYDRAIYRSEDGGATWERRGVVAGVVSQIAFPSANIGYATGPISQPHYNRGYGLYKTEDSGASWRRLSTEVPGVAHSLVFTSEERGFVAGKHGILMCTTDGGETWVQAPLTIKPSLYYVIFPTPDVGYIVGSRCTVLKTTDGGDNWEVLTTGARKFEKSFLR